MPSAPPHLLSPMFPTHDMGKPRTAHLCIWLDDSKAEIEGELYY